MRKTIFGMSVVTAMSLSPAHAGIEEGIALLDAGDVQAAVKEFQTSFDAGHGDGAFYIGRLFELGLGTDQDIARSAQLYAAAAAQGSALAQNRLGLMHLNGETVLQDFSRAAELICGAAEQGDVNGQFNCGLLYSEGKGVAADPAKAIELWSGAAEQGNVAAINYIAQAYRDGQGVEADASKAFEHFSKVGDAGNPLGLFEMAKAYELGQGVAPDLIKAHAHANLAAVRGLPEAGEMRERLTSILSADDLNAAQTMAREWVAKPLTATE